MDGLSRQIRACGYLGRISRSSHLSGQKMVVSRGKLRTRVTGSFGLVVRTLPRKRYSVDNSISIETL